MLVRSHDDDASADATAHAHFGGTRPTVLVTGAFGNVGSSTVPALLATGSRVIAFDLATPANRWRARRWRHPRLSTRWGDVTDRPCVAAALDGADAVVHLAAVIPPASDRLPQRAGRVNVEGTRAIVDALSATNRSIRLVHASSLSVYGRTQHLPPLRTTDEQPNPCDRYGRTKLDAELIVRRSDIDWVVLRLGAVLPLRIPLLIDPIMFDVPLTDRIEFVHPRDVATAIAHAVERNTVSREVLNIGGGVACRLHQRDVIERPLARLGVGMLPEHAFTTIPFHTDWLDTERSQRLLEYQQRTFDHYVDEIARRYRWRRPLARTAAPLIRRAMVRRSPYRTAHQDVP